MCVFVWRRPLTSGPLNVSGEIKGCEILAVIFLRSLKYFLTTSGSKTAARRLVPPIPTRAAMLQHFEEISQLPV